MKLGSLAFILITTFIFGIACSPISFQSDYNPEVDYGGLKAFKFYKDEKITGDVLASQPLLRDKIREAIRQALIKKGFREDKNNPDFLIVLFGGMKGKIKTSGWGYYQWYNPWWGTSAYSDREIDVSHYEQGSIVIDIVLTKNKELVWRGVADGLTRQKLSEQELNEAVDYVVNKILTDFPPDD
ncbi:MAG TPA: DUF4136 domain-containing protein [Calditrichaeota bacterium]|nr:DUF4136 domain-containing protein [Calditrichota bacterium]